jgi:glycosidase
LRRDFKAIPNALIPRPAVATTGLPFSWRSRYIVAMNASRARQRVGLVFPLVLTAACSASGVDTSLPYRRCATHFEYASVEPNLSLYLTGSFNDWSPTRHRLAGPGESGVYAVELELPPGDYAYRFVRNGKSESDPRNPYRVSIEDGEASRLIVDDCRAPRVRLEELRSSLDPQSGTGSIVFSAQFVAGADRDGPDEQSLMVTLNGELLAGTTLGVTSGRLTGRIDGLQPNKYLVSIAIRDAKARPAPPVRGSVWVEQTPFRWPDAVLYFTFTDRFRNGDPSNDKPLPGVSEVANFAGGDFAGIRQSVEEGYFNALGVNVLWISPPQQNPESPQAGADGRPYAGYHGYWPVSGRDVQPRFGSMDELKVLVDACHRRGIRVVLDLVINHLHRDHPYYAAHRGENWFNGDGSCVCATCGWDTHKLDCWFTSYLPDVNYRTKEALDQMVEDTLYWTNQLGVDGFRVDAVKHVDEFVVRTLRAKLNDAVSGFAAPLLLGETFTGENGHGEIAALLQSQLLDAQFDFPSYWVVLGALIRHDRSMIELERAASLRQTQYPSDALLSPFLGSHDLPRILSHANGDIADAGGKGALEQAWLAPPPRGSTAEPYLRLKQAFAFLLTSPGMPMIYYGDEIGLPGAGDPDNRRAMPPLSELNPWEKDLLNWVRQLGQLRRAHPALRGRHQTTIAVDHDAYVYLRRDDITGDWIVVAINRGDTPWSKEVYLPADLALADGMLTDLASNRSLAVTKHTVQLNLEPHEVQILRTAPRKR